MKQFKLIVLIVLIMIMKSLDSFAYDFTYFIEDKGISLYFNWINDKTTVELTYYEDGHGSNCSDPFTVIIPESVEYEGKVYSVSSIGEKAFNKCYNMTAITIPNSVKSIGSYAFAYCRKLTSISIPRSVNYLGPHVFYDCDGLREIYCYADSVPSAYDTAFKGNGYFLSDLLILHVPSNSIEAYKKRSPWSNFKDIVEITPEDPVSGSTEIAGMCGEDVKYKCDLATGSLIIYGSGPINGYKRGSLDNQFPWSLYTNEINSVEIKSGVTSIGDWAFSGSTLNSIDIPNSVISIGESAFRGCSGLISIDIPNSVTSIDGWAFGGCSGLISIDIPNSVTSIGECAFIGCSSMTSISIPEGITTINNSTFSGCSNLTTITIPNSVTSIGEGAFYNCSGLTSIIIPNSVSYIDGLVICGCTNLKDIYCYAEVIPTTVDNTFSSGVNETLIDKIILHVPANAVDAYRSTAPWSKFLLVMSISQTPDDNPGSDDPAIDNRTVINGVIYVINGVGSVEVTGAELGNTTVDILSEVTIGDKTYQVTSIGDRAFEGRSDIDYLSIPYSIKSIGEYAFINCGSNMTVNIEDLASWCQTELGNEHSSPLSSARIVQVNSLVKEKLIIPEGVPYIGNFTFYQCRGISSVTIPSSVKIIGSSAFEDCSGLEKLNISEGLITIGGSSFEGCSSLSTLTIPSTVSTIAINAFKNCMGLKEVYCYAENVPDTHEDAFDVTPTGSSTLYVPAGSVQAYKNSWPWSDFKNIVALGSPTDDDSTISGKCGDNVRYTYNKDNKTLTISGEGAMYDYTIVDASPWSSFADEISSVVIESGVTSIGRRAFTSCGLTSVIIPNTVVSIGDNSFHGCSGLTSVTIPNGVYDIYEYAFAGCSLTSLTLPETISKLEEGTFMINSLTSVTIFATNPPKTEGAQVFSNYDIPLYVPAGSEDAYLAKHPWYNFKEILPISESGEESDYKSLLIGKWELIERNGYEHTHVEFKEDGTFSYTSIDRTYYEEHGIFKVEGDILYEWFSDENEWSPSKIVSVDNENLSLQELLDDGITPLGSVDNYRRVSGSSSILNISIDPEIEGVYSIDGVKVNKPRKGINIIKLKDGTTRKVIIKL